MDLVLPPMIVSTVQSQQQQQRMQELDLQERQLRLPGCGRNLDSRSRDVFFLVAFVVSQHD